MSDRINLVLVGSHLGYPMESTPLGGGAMVGLQLARLWSASDDVRLTVLGSGARSPAAGADYLRLPGPPDAPDLDLVRFSELQYARFCRRFEAATTGFLLDHAERFDPRRTVVVVNDVSESPNLEVLSRRGYRLLSIWHVDVVDFFNRIYLRRVVAPQRLTRAFDWMRRAGLSRLVPDVLRLVFEKQQDSVEFSDRLVLPSRQMADTVRRCYPHLPGRELVVPWGGWEEALPEEAVSAESERLRKAYRIGPGTRVLMTLSRISPEKGIHLLLEALRLLEQPPGPAGRDVCVLVCGEPAFMRGDAYGRRVRRAAERLRGTRVFFPGYLSGVSKQAHFRLADLFVSPSVHESYGLTVVEAMRAGLPVLASDHYGVDETLAPEAGRAVSYGSLKDAPRLLARALGEMLEDREKLRRMGGRAKDAASRMTFSEAARKLLEAATRLAAGP